MYPQDYRRPCEVISYYKEGKVYPLKFRFYSVENAAYYVYEVEKIYRNCARKPIPSLPGFSRGMNGACVAKHIVA